LAILAAVASFFWLVKSLKHRRILLGAFFAIVVLSGSIHGLPIVYRDQQNITSPVGDIPGDVEDEKVFVYYGAVPAMRFHFPERHFFLSQCVTGQVAEMEEEVRALGHGEIALVFTHMLFYEDYDLVGRLLKNGYSLVIDKPYPGSQDGYPGSRLVVLELK